MATGIDDRGIIVTCSSCQQRNRVPFGHESAQATRCKKCGTALPPPAEPVEVPTAQVFDALIAASSLPVIVDFWAPWCGPCRMVAPELARVAAKNAGRYLVVKVNTDAVPELGERFGIRSIPTVAVFKNGQVVVREAGARPATALQDLLKRAA